MNPVHEFLKEAGIGDFFSAIKSGITQAPIEKIPSIAGAIGRGIGMAAVPTAIGVGGALALKGIEGGISSIKERFAKAKSFKEMVKFHPSLKDEDAKSVHALFTSVYHLSPTVAKDPLLSGSLIRNALDRPTMHGVAMPLDMAKALTDIEKSTGGRGPDIGMEKFISLRPLSGFDVAPQPMATLTHRKPIGASGQTMELRMEGPREETKSMFEESPPVWEKAGEPPIRSQRPHVRPQGRRRP